MDKRWFFYISAEPKGFKKSPADALPWGPYPYPCLVHIHECVCTGIYECEDGPFLPLKMTHKTSVLATYAVKAAWGMPFQHSRTSGWVLHTGDQPHLGKSPWSLQGELSWGMARSSSQGLPSSPAGLVLITYAHNPWLVHVIHQPGPRPLAPEPPLLTCLLGGSWVAMATLIFSWQLGFSRGSKSLFSLCVSFSVRCFLSPKALLCLCVSLSMALCVSFLPVWLFPCFGPAEAEKLRL